jgi:hypothetical protein
MIQKVTKRLPFKVKGAAALLTGAAKPFKNCGPAIKPAPVMADVLTKARLSMVCV